MSTTSSEEAKQADGLGQLSIEQEDERLQQLGIRRELRKARFDIPFSSDNSFLLFYQEFTSFSTLSFALGILG